MISCQTYRKIESTYTKIIKIGEGSFGKVYLATSNQN
jgi:hypothetical protein